MSEATPADEVLTEVVLRRYGDHPAPVVALALRALARALREDHVALDLAGAVEGLGDAAAGLLDALAAQPRLAQFAGGGDVIAAAGPPLVVVDERFLYVRRLASAEQRVASAVVASRRDAVAIPGNVSDAALDVALDEVAAHLAAHDTPSPELAEVARRCLTRRVSFVTGGPGTGKTWMVAQVLAALDRALVLGGSEEPVHVVVAAPTGKAAQRVASTLDRTGQGFARLVRDRSREGSIHHLLGLHPGSPTPPRALHHDVVIVDEASMADLDVLDALVRACDADPARPTRLVLVGDPHQLASVNVGAVLADVTDPGAGTRVLVSRLTTVHRTGHRPLIELAAAVNAGDVEEVLGRLSVGGVVTHREDVADEAATSRVLEHAERVARLAEAGDASGALAELSRLVVLAGTREGPGSVAWWNAVVGARQRVRHPPGPGERFSVGEPVLVTRSQRALGVSNGDLGVVIERGGHRVIAFEGARELSLSGVGFLEGAWAITIHKSQGSEFDHVVVSLPRAESALVSRELLYTAITRAGDAVTVLGDRAAIARAVATPVSRVSGLTHRLANWPTDPAT